MSIKYTRQADGTYLKTGEFAAVPAEVLIQVADGAPFKGSYTLEQATKIIEDAIAKGQVQKESYSILPLPEKIESTTKAKKEAVALTDEETARMNAIIGAPEGTTPDAATMKAAIKQLRKEQRAAAKPPKAPKEPRVKTPRVVKYSKDQIRDTYLATKSLDEVVKATGASKVWAQRILVKLGIWEAPVKEPKAPKAPKAPGAGRQTKYSKQQFVDTYLVNHSLEEVCAATGASKVWAQRVLVQQGVWVKPVKLEPAATPEPTPAPTPEPTPVPEATPEPVAKPKHSHKKSAPAQQAPPIE